MVDPKVSYLQNKTVMYDYCLIGSGIASLYCAYLLKKANSLCKLVILERDNRIGGRVLESTLDGNRIVLGAGIGRLEMDHLLLRLLTDFHLQYHPYPKHFERQDTSFLKSCLRKLEKEKKDYNRYSTDFQQYATQVLGEADYQLFKINASFTDFEKADLIDTVDHYGFQDILPIGHGFGVPWNLLLQALVKFIGPQNIRTKHEVTKITRLQVDIKDNEPIYAHKIIASCEIPVLRKLYPNLTELRNIDSQPFLRIYAILNQPLPINSFCIMPNVLQKVIPINPEKNLYMIAYSDNQSALEVDKMTTSQLELLLNEQFATPKPIKILKKRKVFWQNGTHFYYPLMKKYRNRDDFITKVQNPYPNKYIIGEMISNNQGWVEGSLESVQAILPKLLE